MIKNLAWSSSSCRDMIYLHKIGCTAKLCSSSIICLQWRHISFDLYSFCCPIVKQEKGIYSITYYYIFFSFLRLRRPFNTIATQFDHNCAAIVRPTSPPWDELSALFPLVGEAAKCVVMYNRELNCGTTQLRGNWGSFFYVSSGGGDAAAAVSCTLTPAVAVTATGIKIGCNGWNADPSDGRNLNPTVGLNMVDDDDTWSMSVDFRQTLMNQTKFYFWNEICIFVIC